MELQLLAQVYFDERRSNIEKQYFTKKVALPQIVPILFQF